MTIRRKTLKAITLPGLTLDTLGLYFAAIGLLRLLSRRWPQVRGCWRNGVFTVISDNITKDMIFEYLLSLEKDDLIVFKISWRDEIDKSRKNQKSKGFLADYSTYPLQNYRSKCSEEQLAVFDMHLVANKRVSANPIFKNPGGKRKPHDHWTKVVTDALGKSSGKSSLEAALLGDFSGNPKLEKWNAGTWFPSANKIYNFAGNSAGKSLAVYTENGICSWLVLLAINGFSFLTGSASRKLGATSRGVGAFPFTTTTAGPRSKDECGKSEAEFWAPVWNKPFSESEVELLFARSRSEIGTQNGTSSSAFSTAIIARGVDRGLTEFRRFEFRYSTGDKTFEAIQSDRIKVSADRSLVFSEFLSRIIKLRNSLPKDRKISGKWRFEGLQGPIDRALLDLAEVVGEGISERQCEATFSVLDATFAALAKVDRNKAHREAKVAFERLPIDLLAWLAKHEGGSPEFRIALAIASLREEIPAGNTKPIDRNRSPQPFLAYRVGACGRGRFWSIPKDRPLRAVWSSLDLVDNLCALAKRRLIESSATAIAPFRSNFTAPLADVLAFLQGQTDDSLLAQWMDRMSLFDWFDAKANQSKLHQVLRSSDHDKPDWNAEAALYAYFRPLVQDELFRGLQNQITPRFQKRTDMEHVADCWGRRKNEPILATATRLAPVLAAMEREDFDAAWQLAKTAFHAEGIPIADFGSDPPFASPSPRRLLAALIIPTDATSLYGFFRQHWQAPSQPKTNPVGI